MVFKKTKLAERVRKNYLRRSPAKNNKTLTLSRLGNEPKSNKTNSISNLNDITKQIVAKQLVKTGVQEEVPLGAEPGERINGEGEHQTDVIVAEEALGRNISHVM